MSVFDKQFEAGSRQLAMLTSRRGLLSRIGKIVLGAALLAPMLPIDRAFGQQKRAKESHADDENQCDYWKYCSLDGMRCACCGGSQSQCPPGTTVSKVSWVGTCENKMDGKHYLIKYADCCGKSSCGQCYCGANERDRPGYRMGTYNDINWCMGDELTVVHCTLTLVVGVSG
jgi:methylamine dehydrogenase light chain